MAVAGWPEVFACAATLTLKRRSVICATTACYIRSQAEWPENLASNVNKLELSGGPHTMHRRRQKKKKLINFALTFSPFATPSFSTLFVSLDLAQEDVSLTTPLAMK